MLPTYIEFVLFLSTTSSTLSQHSKIKLTKGTITNFFGWVNRNHLKVISIEAVAELEQMQPKSQKVSGANRNWTMNVESPSLSFSAAALLPLSLQQ